MDIKDLINVFELTSDDNVKTYDLTTDEGYKKFKETVNELKDTDSEVFDLFNISKNDFLDNICELADKLHNVNKKSDSKSITKNAINQMTRKEVDHSEETEDEHEFKRPSELLSVNQKLQLHKLVQEYVDTTIKPFNNGILSNEQINDAYAGLYEFGAWIINK